MVGEAPWERWVCAPPPTSQRLFGVAEGDQAAARMLAVLLSTAIHSCGLCDVLTMFLLCNELLCAALQTDGFPCPPPFGNSQFPGLGGSSTPCTLLIQGVSPLPQSPCLDSISRPISLCPFFVNPLPWHCIFLPLAPVFTLPPFSSSFLILMFCCGPDRAQVWQTPCPTCSSPSLLVWLSSALLSSQSILSKSAEVLVKA